MPARILSDEELLAFVPYAPGKTRLVDIERVTELGHATCFVRLQDLTLHGWICSVKNGVERFYYRPNNENNEMKKESDVGKTSPKGFNYVNNKNDSRL